MQITQTGILRQLLMTIFLLIAAPAHAKDWPQACYNETSMWVTNACKEYIETVYYAAPGPDFGQGLASLLVLSSLLGVLLIKQCRRQR